MKKIYVITGATSGIGKILVKKLAKTNVVFAGYRNENYIEDLKLIGAVPFYIDMEKPESISDAAEFILSRTDRIDTLINAAGCVVAGVTEKIPVDRIKKQFEVNCFSHVMFTQKLLTVLGRVINISSMSSFGIFPFVSPYCASKRSLDILFNAMALESGLSVVSVKPGVIATPLWEKSIKNNKDSIENCDGYETQMKYLVKNARKNAEKGLDAEKVADLIIKIDKMQKPKSSYTIGKDAKYAEIFSKLPFDIQNKLIKFGMKLKFNGIMHLWKT